jgi:hypothetical protein
MRFGFDVSTPFFVLDDCLASGDGVRKRSPERSRLRTKTAIKVGEPVWPFGLLAQFFKQKWT